MEFLVGMQPQFGSLSQECHRCQQQSTQCPILPLAGLVSGLSLGNFETVEVKEENEEVIIAVGVEPMTSTTFVRFSQLKHSSGASLICNQDPHCAKFCPVLDKQQLEVISS